MYLRRFFQTNISSGPGGFPAQGPLDEKSDPGLNLATSPESPKTLILGKTQRVVGHFRSCCKEQYIHISLFSVFG